MFDYEFKPGYTSFKAFEEMMAKLDTKIRSELKLTGGAADRAMSRYITRDLRAEDLGVSAPEWTFTPSGASQWVNLVNTFTVADNRYIGIIGVRYISSDDPQVLTQMKIKKAEKDARYWTIQGCNALENESMYFHDPVTIEQNVPVTITAYNATSTLTAQKVIILGIVFEKEGILVSR